ncbi:MAG: hypothetical protein ACYC6M_03090 [Terriglobales bacterium]
MDELLATFFSHMGQHGTTYGIILVGGWYIRKELIERLDRLDKLMVGIHGRIGEHEMVLVDSGLAKTVDTANGQARLQTIGHVHSHHRKDDE